jgi:tetratricopeptide (TPR) repeat protein
VKATKAFAILFLGFVAAGCAVARDQSSAAARIRAEKLVAEAVEDLRGGKLAEAEAGFALAVEIARLPSGFDGRGCVAFQRKKYDEAESWFWRAFANDPKYLRALANLATLYDVSGRAAESHYLYRYVVEREPNDWRNRNNLVAFLDEAVALGRQSAATTVGTEEILKARALAESEKFAQYTSAHQLLDRNLRKLVTRIGGPENGSNGR